MNSSAPAPQQDERQPSCEDLLFTLSICRRNLPLHAHPAHFARLDYLAELVRAGAAAPARTSSASPLPERRY
jgi:hypothetical protein